MRIPTYAVWETVVFALNILAFIFIGLQIRPILEALEPAERGRYFAVAGAVLLTVIVVRLVWHMSFNAVVRWRHRRVGFHPPRPMLRPTIGSGADHLMVRHARALSRWPRPWRSRRRFPIAI